jgi:UDP:flavonoid glycosyltransferase YjiC (YdhE family)
MHFVLIPIGSGGDVYPFIGVGLELRRRGHQVTLITNGYFEAMARRLGFEFAPFGTAEEYLAAIQAAGFVDIAISRTDLPVEMVEEGISKLGETATLALSSETPVAEMVFSARITAVKPLG